MANSIGVKAFRVSTLDELKKLDVGALVTSGPYLLEVMIDGNEVPPLGMRMNVLSGK